MSAIQLLWGLILLLAQLILDFVILLRIFRLSVPRTFGPFTVLILLGIGQFAFALWIMKRFMVEAFVIPTESMKPTLSPGDCFIVNKLLHPRRWDLVAYWHNGEGRSEVYCQRLVGLPGERLRFERGNLYVNDQAQTTPPAVTGQYVAFPPGAPPGEYRYGEQETIQLGPDEFFFIGDVVNRSADSRMYGPANRSSLVGVVDLRYWPLGRVKILR